MVASEVRHVPGQNQRPPNAIRFSCAPILARYFRSLLHISEKRRRRRSETYCRSTPSARGVRDRVGQAVRSYSQPPPKVMAAITNSIVGNPRDFVVMSHSKTCLVTRSGATASRPRYEAPFPGANSQKRRQEYTFVGPETNGHCRACGLARCVRATRRGLRNTRSSPQVRAGTDAEASLVKLIAEMSHSPPTLLHTARYFPTSTMSPSGVARTNRLTPSS
jgi:hypothetical protein